MSFSHRAAPRRRSPPIEGAIALLLALASLVVFLVIMGGRAQAREIVALPAAYAPGTIIISQSRRTLTFQQDWNVAIRYRVGVGKAGKAWRGGARVDGKYIQPAWSPPAEVKRDNPRLPDVIAGGAPDNPMGAAALTLDRGQYAIHGTSQAMRNSVGGAVSYGCIRMLNEDILDLYARVSVGAQVIVVP